MPSLSMQEYKRDWKMAGRFDESDNCYNRNGRAEQDRERL